MTTAGCIPTVLAILSVSLTACGFDDPVHDGGGGGPGGAPLNDVCSGIVPPDCADFPGPAVVTLGFGSRWSGYLPVTDGEPRPVELGAGGLYLYQLALLAEGVDGGVEERIGCRDDPLVSTEIWHQGVQIGGSGAGMHVGLTQTSNGLERLQIWTPFDSFDDIPMYVDETVELRVSITDRCDNHAEDDLTVVVVQ